MRAGLLSLFFLCLTSMLLAGHPSGLVDQDTVQIDTSEYIPNNHNYNLIIASYYGYSSEVLRLLNRGANANTKTFDGITPLMYAVQNGDLTTSKILVFNGADVNQEPFDGASAIIAASRSNILEIVDLLIYHGADVNDTDQEGGSPLLYGSGYYYYDLCSLLLRNGANPEIRDKEGTTPLMSAVYGGNPDMIELLIRYGANINSRDSDGITAFMIAAQNGDTAMIRILKGYEVDLNMLSKSGFSALDIAIKNGHTEAAEMIIGMGAETAGNGRNNPHSLAVQYGHVKLARQLSDLGIKPKRLPSFNQMWIFAGINSSFNDLMGGGELGLRDPRYKLNILAGYQVRLFAKRILKEAGNDTYIQLWENRSLAYLGLTKEFILVRMSDSREFSLSAGLLGGYTFGKNYRGSENRPEELWKIIPSLGLSWGREKFRLELNYEYLNLDTHKVSPHRFMIGLKYRFGFKNNRLKDKYITWY
jgi:ankyrin repeat protein